MLAQARDFYEKQRRGEVAPDEEFMLDYVGLNVGGVVFVCVCVCVCACVCASVRTCV